MMIDDDTLKQLLRINDELMQLCKRLNEKRDIETSSRLIPLVDEPTHILLEAGKEKTALMQSHGDTSSTVQAINGRCPEMWLSVCVGCASRETPQSPVCLTSFDLFYPADV